MTERRKRSGAAATREAILKAAQVAFTRYGYEGAGVRLIASEAGATAALVNRYFGSKEALFVEALGSKFTLDGLLPAERNRFAETIARYVLNKDKSAYGEFDPLIAMLRSAGNSDAARLMREALESAAVRELAEWLGNRPGDHMRGAMFVAVLAGVAVVRDVLGLNSLKGHPDLTERLLVRLLETLVDEAADHNRST